MLEFTIKSSVVTAFIGFASANIVPNDDFEDKLEISKIEKAIKDIAKIDISINTISNPILIDLIEMIFVLLFITETLTLQSNKLFYYKTNIFYRFSIIFFYLLINKGYSYYKYKSIKPIGALMYIILDSLSTLTITESIIGIRISFPLKIIEKSGVAG